ncbi:tail fiber domain-containing protein [Lacibacter sediminis]|uniref:Tail fiber domain-containing protein n=1 Tax=Lacibacter sediminis TaxID=2760713 RepID=A0A7G5XJ73_9BACT|nr:tail fiber domain-containing protein [Lacibacter sediminis]QNA45526.1 tail fiber domain-containing protein [Lacibacter sediminis]
MFTSIKYIAFITVSFFISTNTIAQTINDEQTKLNVASISNPVERLSQLKPISFEYNTKQYKFLNLQTGKQYGFLSDNIQAVFPELVKEKRVSYMQGKNNYKNASIASINETSLIPVLVASIVEQQKQIDQLKSEIEALKKKKDVAVTQAK